VRADGSQRTTPITAAQCVSDRLLLQGIDEGPLTWNLDIAESTGDMALAGIEEDLGFVIFGDCTAD
jgi:hypothetical protein